jgi:hypothetical protein
MVTCEKQLHGAIYSSAWYFAELSRYSIGKFDVAVTARNEWRIVIVRALCGRVREFGLETRR